MHENHMTGAGDSPLLPEIFQMIDDDMRLTTGDIAELVCKSPETVRRWIRTGQLMSISPNTYVVTGKQLKEFLAVKLIKRH
jgi:hypothetical protein